MQKIILFGKECTLTFGRYNNNTIAIEAEHNGEPYYVCTVNWEANWQGNNQYKKAFPFPAVVIKNYSENEGIVNELFNAGVLQAGGAYLAGSAGTVEVRLLTEKWQLIAKDQLEPKKANTAEQLQKIFNRANIILSACCLRANDLRRKADILSRAKVCSKKIFEVIAKVDEMQLRAERIEARGRKVWDSVTSYQGKYVNWRELTEDGQPIFDMILNIGISYEKNLPAARKLAGI